MAKPGPKARPLDDPVAEEKRQRRLAQRRESYYRNHEAEKKSRRRKSAARRAAGYDRYESEKTYYLQARYGISLDDYNDLVEKQDGKCASCGSDGTDNRKARFDIDHDHVTGRVRGLLCAKCNRALGMLDDDIDKITMLLSYMVSHQDALQLVKE